MNIGPSAESSLTGIQKSLRDLEQTAHRIANDSNGNSDPNTKLENNLINLKASKTAVEANAKSLEVYSETLGSIINVFA